MKSFWRRHEAHFHSLMEMREKKKILKTINQRKLGLFFASTLLTAERISLQFAQKLSANPKLLDYFIDNSIDTEIVNKINDGKLKICDVKSYSQELFSFDIFSEEDKDLAISLSKGVDLSKQHYLAFTLNDFESRIEHNNYEDSYITSFIADISLFVKKRKSIPFSTNHNISSSSSFVCIPLKAEQISWNGVSMCYSGKISFDEDTTLFIPYHQYLEWINDKEKRKILERIHVSIIDTNETERLRPHFMLNNESISLNDDASLNEVLIQVNHLLYLVEHSIPDNDTKDYYRYKISKSFLLYSEEKNNNSSSQYSLEFRRIARAILREINKEDIDNLSLKFNELDYSYKTKDVTLIKYSSKIFLYQFDNFDQMTAFEVLDYVTNLTPEEIDEVLKDKVVINKLQGLLRESASDQHRYYALICEKLNVNHIFKVFDVTFVRDYFNSNKGTRRDLFFYYIINSDANYAVEFLLNDDEYFIEFMRNTSSYRFTKLDFSLLIRMLKKIESLTPDAHLEFISKLEIDTQHKLFQEDFSNSFLIKLVTSSASQVQQSFYLEDRRFSYLWEKFNIIQLSRNGFIFPDDIVSKKEFFAKFNCSSMARFRADVNQFLIHQPNIYFENRVNEYEDYLISCFDGTTGLFKQYSDLINNIDLLYNKNYIASGNKFLYDEDTIFGCRNLDIWDYDYSSNSNSLNKNVLINYFREVSKLKLNEIVVDRLFKDNIYNVFLNIREMLRFNSTLANEEKVLDESKINFYETILNIDKLDTNTILGIYQQFKDSNIALMFYEDIQKLKYKSYDKIKEVLFQPNKRQECQDASLSSKYGIPIFDLRGHNYVILARCLLKPHNDLYAYRRSCYTLFSNENTTLYDDDHYIYGYSEFSNDCVLHVFENDSASSDLANNKLSFGSTSVNRIMTVKEIVTNSLGFSEIQIVNKKSEEDGKPFDALQPTFLIVFDEINDKVLEEAQKKGLPICIISHSCVIENNFTFNDDMETTYLYGQTSLEEEEARRKRRFRS